MNVRDAEVVTGLLVDEGYAFVEDAEDADIVLFNTCSVRDHAEQRVWSAAALLARKKKRPLIGILGCMAQNYKGDILKKIPNIDIICGPSEIDNIALYLKEALRGQESVVAVQERRRRDAIYHTGFRQTKDHAYIVISEGCDNYCSYCVVPYVRGRLRHRDVEEILKEAAAVVSAGIRNITLLGQNVNSYSARGIDFAGLLKRVCGTPGLKSVSFLTCHPKDTTRELFEAMAAEPLVKRCLHMPFQSGSDRILAAMNRGYTKDQYLALVEDYRRLVYNASLSADMIVGFPTETEEDFIATRDLVERARFDNAYIFKYSSRPHTAAAELADDVPQKEKERRHAVLLALQKKISLEKKRERHA